MCSFVLVYINGEIQKFDETHADYSNSFRILPGENNSLNFLISFIIPLIFILVPLLISFLEGLQKPDEEGMYRNLFVIIIYVFLTLGLYGIY